jgi:hypothetical protein
MELVTVLLALALAALAGLAWRLVGEVRRRRAAEAALAGREAAAAERARRLALFDRRVAAVAPLDSLWLAWSRACRPDAALVRAAANALPEARLLFDSPLAGECEALLGLLLGYERHQDACRAAVASGRHRDHGDLLDRELEMERPVKAALAALRARLAEAARVPDS